jgi:hypothetical protein
MQNGKNETFIYLIIYESNSPAVSFLYLIFIEMAYLSYNLSLLIIPIIVLNKNCLERKNSSIVKKHVTVHGRGGVAVPNFSFPPFFLSLLIGQQAVCITVILIDIGLN